MKLYTFGDSHAFYGWENLTIENLEIIPFPLALDGNPITCSSFGFEKLNVLNILNYGVKDNDIVVFQFGETDMRYIFMHNSASHNHFSESTFQELMDKILDNYFIAIKQNVDQLKNLLVIVSCHYPISLVSPPPSEFRRTLHRYFNTKIKEKCKEYNYVALDTYYKYADENENLNAKYSDGHVHIKNPIFVKEELLNIFEKYSIKF